MNAGNGKLRGLERESRDAGGEIIQLGVDGFGKVGGGHFPGLAGGI